MPEYIAETFPIDKNKKRLSFDVQFALQYFKADVENFWFIYGISSESEFRFLKFTNHTHKILLESLNGCL